MVPCRTTFPPPRTGELLRRYVGHEGKSIWSLATHNNVRREPFNSTPMGVNSMPPAQPHVQCTTMVGTCK